MSVVLQDWVTKLSYKDQCDLMSVLRGIDTDNGEVKKVTKLFRHSILNVSDPKQNYFKLDKIDIDLMTDAILDKGLIDSRHWYEHVIKAAYLIRDKCDNLFVKNTWVQIINKLDNTNIHPPHILRMIKELRDLKDKASKLATWLSNEAEIHGNEAIYNDDNDQYKQLEYMEKYILILHKRLEKETKPKES